MTNPLPVKLSKKNFAIEERRSKQFITEQLPAMRKAILTATRVSYFYDDYVQRQKSARLPIMIMPRDAHQMLQQMRNQKLYICETPNEVEPTVLAASNLWDYEMPVPSDDIKTTFRGYASERFLEIGSQVSVLSGFNFQWTLTSVSLVENFLFEPHGILFAAIYGDNDASRKNFLSNMHFVEWNDVPPTLESVRMHHLREGGLDEVKRGVTWLRPTLRSLIESARRIVQLNDNPLQVANGQRCTTDPISSDKILFSFDKSEFRVVSFDYILNASRDLIDRQPKTFSELSAIAGRALGRNFLHFPA